MRHLAHRLLFALVSSLALGGCGSLDRQHVSADTHHNRMQDSEPANQVASTSQNKEVAPKAIPAERRTSINLHLFGLSFHPDREGTRRNHVSNEFNYGTGFGYKLHENARGVVNSEAGFYYDSGRNWAKFAGVNYFFKLQNRWRFGADLMLIQSPTYNGGELLVALTPHLTYDFGPAKLNVIYVPKYKQINQFAAFGFYLTIPLWK
jgi:hypothetical protein